MTTNNKEQHKRDFKEELNRLSKELKSRVSTDGGDWTIKGFIDVHKNIYTISSDTKIVSKILEIHIFPRIIQFANSIGYRIVLAEKQNWYPDLTFVHKEHDSVKFALDIKTTFRRNEKTAGFTLGSHGGYFKDRNKDKNIQFPYNQYLGHYCLGIIYTRRDMSEFLQETTIYQSNDLSDGKLPTVQEVGSREITTVDHITSIASVIKDFEFFVAEKWKIASDKQGSGNTANIGSIMNIDDLRTENGVFSKLGEEWFDEYWMNHGSATMIREGRPVKITNLKDFLQFKGRTDLWDILGYNIVDKRNQGK